MNNYLFLFFTVTALLLSYTELANAEPTTTSEFERALDLIEQTQLEIFIHSPPTDKTEILAELDSRIKSSEYPKKNPTNVSREVAIMRELLSESMEQFDDQYANYITPEQLKSYNERRSGNYVGVGLKFRTANGEYPLVIGALSGGPLYNTDLKPGDRLLEADGTDLKDHSTSQIKNLLKGPPDSKFQLTILRENNKHTVTSMRKAVDLHYARSEILEDGIGYLKISRFGGKTHDRVGSLLKDMIAKDISSVVLDLRDNPGGSTRAARAIVSMFTHEANIYCEVYKTGATRELPRHGPHITDLPLAILVNGESKSSSEIVAGSLQAYGRGLIIGSPTFGKGLVQKVFRLKDPLGGALRTTIAMFGTPDHEIIHGGGIVPDYYIETEADFMFRQSGSLNINDEARAYQRQLLEQQVRNKYKHTDSAKGERLIAAQDKQLLFAISQLTGKNI